VNVPRPGESRPLLVRVYDGLDQRLLGRPLRQQLGQAGGSAHDEGREQLVLGRENR